MSLQIGYGACKMRSLTCINVFIGYQRRQNRKDTIDFNLDLEVMEKLIANNPLETSIEEMFGKMIPSKKGKFLHRWNDLNKADDLTIKRNKSFRYKKEDGKIAAQLLLLLTYMFVSNVNDDTSNEMQM